VKEQPHAKPERNAEIRSLRQQGFTYRQIAERFGISPPRAREIVLNKRRVGIKKLNALGSESAKAVSRAERPRPKPERNAEIRSLRQQGFTYRQIADRFGITPQRARLIVLKKRRVRIKKTWAG
jgi:transcriptional regulator with XRE-family HTH domain